ncbi:MAG: magnesium transporter CorA family protein [Frankiaceae bacterium]
MRHNRVYREGQLVRSDVPFAHIQDELTRPGTVVWMDLCEPTPGDLALLAEAFALSPLAVEDALSERQRPKVDIYPDHIYVALYAVEFDAAGGLSTTELGVFASPRYLVTVRKGVGFDMGRVVARWDDLPGLAASGVGFLLYGLIDTVVDGQFDAVQRLDDAIESVEDELFSDKGPNQPLQRRTFLLRKWLAQLRRVVLPMRDVLNTLLRRDLQLVDDRLQPYYQDVYDHVLRAGEWSDSLRDFLTTILETNLTIQGNRLNDIMKVLTGWAAVIAVPTAITGFFGMNVLFPAFGTHGGFYIALLLVVGTTIGIYALMRSRHWL